MNRLILPLLISFLFSGNIITAQQKAEIKIDFNEELQEWDGFGVNYVETRHTRDYAVFQQDYGGFKYLNEEDRQKVIEMIFGVDGLKPGIIKAFLDPFHEIENDNDDPFNMDMSKFDHETTTKWIRYFYTEAENKVAEWGGELTYLAGLYGPPGWMSQQKSFRGRDLDPAMKLELAEYCISWAKHLKDEGLNVKYISMHNEGEDVRRWNDAGTDDTLYYHHDYNMWWNGAQVADFLAITDEVLLANNMLDVKFSTGETSTWERLNEMWYEGRYKFSIADYIRNNKEAIRNLGLITSHGFQKKYDPTGVNKLKEMNPDLHVWTTSYTWDPMDVQIVEDARNLIYGVGCNSLIPWAIVHNDYESDKLHPPMKFRISSNASSPFKTNDGKLTITKAYYYFKQICRAGQPGMSVTKVKTDNSQIQAIAFSRNLTINPDAFVIINNSEEDQMIRIEVSGATAEGFEVFCTSDPNYSDFNYKSMGKNKLKDGNLIYNAPAKSASTFYGISE